MTDTNYGDYLMSNTNISTWQGDHILSLFCEKGLNLFYFLKTQAVWELDNHCCKPWNMTVTYIYREASNYSPLQTL